MRYWITTQWPIRTTSIAPHTNVYLQQRHRAVGDRMSVGDRVVIYEAKKGPTVVKKGVDGVEQRIKTRRGVIGIVADAQIAGPITIRPHDEANVEYVDGRKANWAWLIPTRNENYDGYVPKAEVLRVLDYNPDYTMRGFGEQNSGVREISEAEYNELIQMFRTTPRPHAP